MWSYLEGRQVKHWRFNKLNRAAACGAYSHTGGRWEHNMAILQRLHKCKACIRIMGNS